MSVDFNREVDRRSTSDVKWRPEGLKGYLPIEVIALISKSIMMH